MLMDCASGVEKLFWLPVENELLEPVQREHEAECGPFRLALELMDGGVRLELLARATEKMRCECIAYLCPASERVMMERLDALVAEVQQDELQSLFGLCC